MAAKLLKHAAPLPFQEQATYSTEAQGGETPTSETPRCRPLAAAPLSALPNTADAEREGNTMVGEALCASCSGRTAARCARAIRGGLP